MTKETYLILNGKSLDGSVYEKISKTSLDIMGYYDFYDFKLSSNIEFYHFDKEVKSYKNISEKYDNINNTTLKTLMISYNTPLYSLFYGVIPFRGGKFATIKDDESHGNGIELLTDQVFVGYFASIDCWAKFILGRAAWQDNINYNSLPPKNNGGVGDYILVTKQLGNNYIEFNYFKVYITLDLPSKETFRFGVLDLIGFGYIYDDSFDSNLVYWFEGGYSRINENIRQMAINSNPGGIGGLSTLSSLGYKVDDADTQGFAFKTGVKYSDEISSYDYDIGFEYFKTYDGWVSMNQGILFNSNYSYWQNRGADQISIFGNIYINNHVTVGINASHSKSSYVSNPFSAAATTNPDTYDWSRKDFTVNERLVFSLKYKF